MIICDFANQMKTAKCLSMISWSTFSGVTAALMVLVHPALAGQTPWVEVGPQSRIRLVSSDTVANGITMAAIEIDMPQSTKTYWRIPGESGIPLLLDTSASKHIGSTEILWPYPHRESTGGYLDFVYHGRTVLPLQIEVRGDTPKVVAELLLGICDEICIPVRVDLALDLNFEKSDVSQTFRINQALADVPSEWTMQPQPIGDVRVKMDTGILQVAYTPGTLDPNSIIIDTGKPVDLFSLPQNGPESGLLYFKPLDSVDEQSLDGTQVTVTFVTVDGVFELQRIVQPIMESN